MPVQFLTAGQRADYGRYVAEPTEVELNRYLYLDDADLQQLRGKRGEHNRLGFAVQLTAVRYLGRFLDDTTQAPPNVLSLLSKQLGLTDANCLLGYRDQRQRFRHIEEICQKYGYYGTDCPTLGRFASSSWLSQTWKNLACQHHAHFANW